MYCYILNENRQRYLNNIIEYNTYKYIILSTILYYRDTYKLTHTHTYTLAHAYTHTQFYMHTQTSTHKAHLLTCFTISSVTSMFTFALWKGFTMSKMLFQVWAHILPNKWAGMCPVFGNGCFEYFACLQLVTIRCQSIITVRYVMFHY